MNLGKPSVVVNDRSPKVGNIQQYKPNYKQPLLIPIKQYTTISILTKMARKTSNMKNKSVSYDSSDEEEDLVEFGLALEKLTLGPRKKLLVLSLGGLLCHRVFRHDKSKIPRYRDPDTSYGSFLGEYHFVFKFWHVYMFSFCSKSTSTTSFSYQFTRGLIVKSS